MQKVVEVIPILNMGGAESMVRDYCLLLDRNKYDVSVIVLTEHMDTPIEQDLKEAGIRVIYLGEQFYKTTELNVLQRMFRRILRFYYFGKTIRLINPDVIHLHLQIGMYMRTLPLKKMRSRIFLTVHNVPERYFCTEKKSLDKYIEFKEVNRLIHKYNMTLITLHEGLKEELKELFKTDKVIVLRNGIRTERFDPNLYDRRHVRDKLDIGEDDIVIGNVGSMHPQKNHDLILDVFDRFHQINLKSKLLLIGSGELKDRIIRRIDELGIKEDVIVLSNRNDIPQLMKAMDVFLFPSRWEGFGNVLIEAQCMGLHCVISDAVPDDVRITDKVHVVSLNSSIEDWINELDKALNGTAGLGPLYTKDMFDMKNSIKKLEKLFNGVIS